MKFLATSIANIKKQPNDSIKPSICWFGSVANKTIPIKEQIKSITHFTIVNIAIIIFPFFLYMLN
ncbi:hypothetical protein HTVC100P_gp02 [Pelagibacter phage HTVC100P]|nr:hypothetical protein HTVC100P_gp02 [Pelagibacter phage HTVC100P]